MELYDDLLNAVQNEYDRVRILKADEHKTLSVLRHKTRGTRYIFRNYEGSGEVYRKLLPISCPHLPQIMEAAEWNGKTAVLEEYVQGDTLYFLLEGGNLSAAKAKDIMLQLCRGLSGLHSLGAVHRDIKPENVILRGDEAVLIDFDASRIVKAEHDADTVILGTVGFAAPEQYGLSQSDERADIYSLGVLLNVMLTGKHPSKELASGKMGRIVRRCTMVNPKERYQNVHSLMKAL